MALDLKSISFNALPKYITEYIDAYDFNKSFIALSMN
jgi:hypothetical protein